MHGQVIVLLEGDAHSRNVLIQHVLDQAHASGAQVRFAAQIEDVIALGRAQATTPFPTLVVIGPTVPHPIRAARQVDAAGIDTYFVFAPAPADAARLRQQLAYAGPRGGRWAMEPADSAQLAQTIRDGLTATQQRKRLRTTLERINLRLSAPPAIDPTRYRQLIVSDRYLASILTHAPDAIISLDTQGTVVSWNQGAERLFGVPASRATGARLAALLPGIARIEEMIAQVARGDSSASELQWHAPGHVKYLDATFTPIRDDAQYVIGLAAIIRDVTERKRAEEALRASETRLRHLFEQALTGIAETDLSGRFIRVNDQYCRIVGRSREELLTLRLQDITHPDDLPGNLEQLQLAIRRGPTFGIEKRYVRPDGSLVWVHNSVSPLLDAQGRPQTMIALVLDITERKQTETALRESEEQLRFLDELGEATRASMDAGATMELTARMLGRHLQVSRCAYADVEADSNWFTIRHDWTDGVASTVGTYQLDQFGPHAASDMRSGRTLILHDVDEELAPDQGAATFDALGIRAIVCCPLVKGGRLVAMMAVHSRTPRHWTEREVALVRAVVERSWAHIERIRFEERLREADRRKDEFLATLAHELRNPLAPIRNAVQILKSPKLSESQREWSRSVIDRQVQQMARLLDDLLDVSRITRGKLALRKERISVQQAIEWAVETARPLIEARGHELRVQLPAEPLMLDADPVRMTQILGNLLTNAAKYTDPPGRIAIVASCEAATLLIRVQDSGIGMTPEQLSRLFEMFAQAPEALERSEGGLGVGLAITKGLVELHGGSIEVHSEGSGRGSEFVVRLPRAAPL